MFTTEQLQEVDRIINETPIQREEILNPYDSMLPEIEVDDATETLRDAAQRVRAYLASLRVVSVSENTPEGVSSKDQEFIDLQVRKQRARAAGYNSNAYVCEDCVAEGRSAEDCAFLDWPDVIDGKTLCARHATQHVSDSSSSKAV
jgi:hypothetical protein